MSIIDRSSRTVSNYLLFDFTTIANILDILDPQFLYNVIHQAHDNNEKFRMTNRSRGDDNENTFSLRLSLIIAVYCNIHYEIDLDVTMFQLLTDRRHLPILESQAAKVFLELQEKLSGVQNATVTSLTERCISVLASNWNTTCIKKEHCCKRNATLQMLLNFKNGEPQLYQSST